MSRIGMIVEREYLQRVTKKSFIITTILVPLAFVLLTTLPSILMVFYSGDKTTYGVIDRTGILASQLKDNDDVCFLAVDDDIEKAKADEQLDGVLFIGSKALENPNDVSLFIHGASSVDKEQYITSCLEKAIENERLKAYNIENLDEIMKEVNADVSLQVLRLDKIDSDEAAATSTGVSFGLGLTTSFILYFILVIYGQMVMTSIIEEKNNRVLEIVVSSVKPEQLMMGKILGIGLTAVTQLLIWGIIIGVGLGIIIPLVMPADLMADATAMQAGTFDAAASENSAMLVQGVAVISDFGYMLSIFGWMLLFLIGGFLLYASIFAAIGSAVDNIQDASQLQMAAMLPIMIATVFDFVVAKDPNSAIAFWLSIIPFTSPMNMLIRIPFGIPVWEIILSVVLLYAGFIFMVWFAAKVYRVGIFMYGKKPTVKELIKWARYK